MTSFYLTMMRVVATAVITTVVGSYVIASGPYDAEFVMYLAYLGAINLIASMVLWGGWSLAGTYSSGARTVARGFALAALSGVWLLALLLYALLPPLAFIVLAGSSAIVIAVVLLIGAVSSRSGCR